ncbi:SIMPL domain-containing protein [Serinicoccus sp. LYQ131]|uniref:SIMPL domain-containing protein n=1 Tax=Serinicoccus sp. LYQ131 TaxID=3378797 RepID=UPI003854DBA3
MDAPPSIVVTGTGRASAAPDALVVDVQLEGHGRSVTAALAALTEASEAATAALPGHRLTTHGLGLHARSDRDGRQVGHTAYQSVRVRTQDPAGAGELIQRLGEAVGDRLTVHQLRPEIADTTALLERARADAVADARAKAEHYARLVGMPLGPARWVREPGPEGPGPSPRMELMSQAAGPPVDPADHEVAVTVEVAWGLG